MDVVREDRRFTVRSVGDIIGIGRPSVKRILSDLSMTRVCAQWVPRLLNEDQRQSRASASEEVLNIQQKDALYLKRNEYDVKQASWAAF